MNYFSFHLIAGGVILAILAKTIQVQKPVFEMHIQRTNGVNLWIHKK